MAGQRGGPIQNRKLSSCMSRLGVNFLQRSARVPMFLRWATTRIFPVPHATQQDGLLEHVLRPNNDFKAHAIRLRIDEVRFGHA